MVLSIMRQEEVTAICENTWLNGYWQWRGEFAGWHEISWLLSSHLPCFSGLLTTVRYKAGKCALPNVECTPAKLNWTPWPECESELYRPNHHCLSAKLVLTFADRGMSLSQHDGTLRPHFRFSRPEPLLFLSSSNSRGSVVVKALSYKPEGCRFDTRWGNFSICLILPDALGPGFYSVSNRNEYQKHKNNNVSGE
jgi:hypothetical protein